MTMHRFYEFFAGGGMVRAALGPEWECLFANDFDPKKAAAYSANWQSDCLHVGDVGEVLPRQLPGHADLAWASFPCQDLSLAGVGAGLNGARSGAFWPFWSLMTALKREGRKPKTIVLENVCGLLNSHGGSDFRNLCEAVSSAGYWIGAIVADARDFLPQSRPRLFLIALDNDLSVPGRVQGGYAVDHWHPARLRTAQAQLPECVRSQWLWFAPPTPEARNISLLDIIEEHPKDVRWHTAEETQRLLDMMSPVNRAKVELVTLNKVRAVGAVYKRTRVEGGKKLQRAEIRFDLAGCLRTPGGGSSRQQILVSDNGRVRTRLISARETARLMGLDESFSLPDRYNDAYHLTGDGVAVPVVRHIIQSIVMPFVSTKASERIKA